jgi:hypothetical protein
MNNIYLNNFKYFGIIFIQKKLKLVQIFIVFFFFFLLDSFIILNEKITGFMNNINLNNFKDFRIIFIQKIFSYTHSLLI